MDRGLLHLHESRYQARHQINSRSAISCLFKTQLNHEVKCFFDRQKIDQWPKVSPHASLRGPRRPRRLAWGDTFCRCIVPYFTEHGSRIHTCIIRTMLCEKGGLMHLPKIIDQCQPVQVHIGRNFSPSLKNICTRMFIFYHDSLGSLTFLLMHN